MSYSYTFHYTNGRRAIMGDYRVAESKAIKAGCELSLEKKKVIVIRRHTPDWYNDQNWVIATCKDGRVLS